MQLPTVVPKTGLPMFNTKRVIAVVLLRQASTIFGKIPDRRIFFPTIIKRNFFNQIGIFFSLNTFFQAFGKLRIIIYGTN